MDREWADLIIPNLHLFPPAPNANQSDHPMLPIWVDDVAHHSPSWEILSRSREMARKGESGFPIPDMSFLTIIEAEGTIGVDESMG